MENDQGEVILPEADAVINTKRPDCIYPYKCLCGAGIAYKLVTALLEFYEIGEKASYQEELLSYTAIATVCDVMDLTGENRIIVSHGLRLLKETKNKGLLALIDLCRIDLQQLSAFHLGYIIGPCLNASGRLDTARKGLELLLTGSEEEALVLAAQVKELNDVRKEMTADNAGKAFQLIEESNLIREKVLVVYLPDCHESIAGIIAGRVRERYNRPAIVLTGAKDCIKGSARSIEQYNMIEELSKCRDLLLKAGGHPMAAGLSLLPENLELLRVRLNENTILTDEMLIPKVVIDIRLPLGFLSEQLIDELKRLEPYGKCNDRPLFAEKDLKVKSAFVIGKNASGLRLRVQNQYGKEMDALYFGDVEEFFQYIKENYGVEEADRLKTGRTLQNTLAVTYTPRINEYNGFKNIQIMIQNYR